MVGNLTSPLKDKNIVSLVQIKKFCICLFICYSNTHHVESIKNDFKYALWPENDEDADICCEVVCGLFSVLINIGAHSQRDIAKPCQELLQLIIEQVIRYIR